MKMKLDSGRNLVTFEYVLCHNTRQQDAIGIRSSLVRDGRLAEGGAATSFIGVTQCRIGYHFGAA